MNRLHCKKKELNGEQEEGKENKMFSFTLLFISLRHLPLLSGYGSFFLCYLYAQQSPGVLSPGIIRQYSVCSFCIFKVAQILCV